MRHLGESEKENRRLLNSGRFPTGLSLSNVAVLTETTGEPSTRVGTAPSSGLFTLRGTVYMARSPLLFPLSPPPPPYSSARGSRQEALLRWFSFTLSPIWSTGFGIIQDVPDEQVLIV